VCMPLFSFTKKLSRERAWKRTFNPHLNLPCYPD
jgi:hypothetical protein